MTQNARNEPVRRTVWGRRRDDVTSPGRRAGDQGQAPRAAQRPLAPLVAQVIATLHAPARPAANPYAAARAAFARGSIVSRQA